MREKFGFGSETASSSRIESNFNHLKNRVFKNENMPLRIDVFLEKLITYYRGDHLLIQAEQMSCESLLSKDKPIDKINECTTFINELEEINDTLLFENENCEENKLSDDSKDSDEGTLSNNYLLRNVNDDIIEIVKKPKQCKTNEQNKELTDSRNLTENNDDLQNKTLQIISNQPLYDTSITEDCSTGLLKCIICKKSIDMLLKGSISILGTEEGFEKKRICFSCDKKKSITAEKVVCEKWGKKGQTKKKQRSAHSYLVPQPGFEMIDFNKKAFIKPIFFLKNGNNMMRPISVPGIGKIVLNNTCAIDSILSVLAS